MTTDFIIHPLKATDGSNAVHVFFDAVHNGSTQHYSKAQRIAWAGQAPDVKGWRNRLEGTSGFAALRKTQMIGFMTIDKSGYIDLAFVHSDAMGQGIGRMLYQRVEQQAQEWQCSRLTTHASQSAKPFFYKLGWQHEAQQIVTKNGVDLINHLMFKQL